MNSIVDNDNEQTISMKQRQEIELNPFQDSLQIKVREGDDENEMQNVQTPDKGKENFSSTQRVLMQDQDGRLYSEDARDQEVAQINRSSSEYASIEKEGRPNDIRSTSQFSRKVLTLGTGGDNQSHVIRPHTASYINRNNQVLAKARRGLDTITEKQDEDAIMASHGATGKFEIESSHSFSLRNFNPRGSVMNLDTI